jgi:hypothetical protein
MHRRTTGCAGRLTSLQPHRKTGCADRLTGLQPRRTTGYLGRLTRLQPRRFTLRNGTTDYPGTRTPVAGRPCRLRPDIGPPPHGPNSATRASTGPVRPDSTARVSNELASHADHSRRPPSPTPGAIPRVTSLLRGGEVMWEHPTKIPAALSRAPA